jgi:hypothetical protein
MKKEVCNAYTELNDPAVQRARWDLYVSYFTGTVPVHTGSTPGMFLLESTYLTLNRLPRYRIKYFYRIIFQLGSMISGSDL